MKREIFNIVVLLLTVSESIAQNVTFFSPEFEEGVKRHLSINASTTVTQQQTDTITDINLSGMGIKDIRDVVYLSNVKTLDLSYNEISDVAPLLPLDSLHNVDLRNNLLEDISELSFASSDSLVVNVAYNYITDFHRFFLPSNCIIRIAGMSAQKDKNEEYMDVYLFFSDVINGQTVVNYLGYSNMASDAFLDCGSMHVVAKMDGSCNVVSISNELTSTTKATLSNGENSSETYVVPSSTHIVGANETVTIDTELPEHYQIGYLRALSGTVEAVGNTLHYTAPSSFEADTLYMSYYEGNRIRGFAQMYFKIQDIINDVNTTQLDSPFKMSLHDGILSINGTPEQLKGVTAVKVFDPMGRVLAAEKQVSQQGIVIALDKSSSIVIVEVSLEGRCIVKKVATR